MCYCWKLLPRLREIFCCANLQRCSNKVSDNFHRHRWTHRWLWVVQGAAVRQQTLRLANSHSTFFTHSDSNHRKGFSLACICLSVPHNVSKTVAARITKLDIDAFHVEFWKPIHMGSKVSGQENSVSVGFALLWVSAGYFVNTFYEKLFCLCCLNCVLFISSVSSIVIFLPWTGIAVHFMWITSVVSRKK